jgi:alkylated DNA nucleotide flippase Atl1
LPQILAVVPAGRWTSFADIGKVLGVGAGEIGQRLEPQMGNAHRVLRLRQATPTSADQRNKLKGEGLRFDQSGRAEPGLRFGEKQLRIALGEVAEAAEPPDLSD